MAFKKLNEELLVKLNELGFENPTPLQKEIIPKIKSGGAIYGLGAQGAGKTEALIISVLQRLKMKPQGDNPIALIFVKDKESVLALAERFEQYTRYSDIRIRTVYEERIINHQKDEIYKGADIVIATPKRLSKLYFLNGINLMELKMIIIEDAEFLIGTDFHTDIHRITQSVKAQHIVFAEKWDRHLEKLQDLFMINAQIVKAN
ncbi:DEAD/DEAH box helicase [Crocinitomix sp.]|nr:DEAD/DEAH box helicase [Crocinitomix sp.]